MKILLIEDDSALLDKMTFILESISGVSVIAAGDFQQAQKAINGNPGLHLIVADYRSGNTPVVEQFQKTGIYIQTILCVDNQDDETTSGWKIFEKIERPQIAAQLKKSVESFFQLHGDASEKLKFCRIKTSLLLETSPLHADIYAKLSETKYLKIFHAGDVFDADDFKKYTEDKKIEYMHLREDSCGVFIAKYLEQIEVFLKKKKQPSYEELSSMNAAAYESIQELTSVLGFTKQVQELTKAHVQMAVQFMDKKPSLNKLLSRLKSTQGKYTADHGYLVSYIACAISNHLQWASETTFFKLSLAAFLHDMALSDDILAACTTFDEAKSIPGITEAELDAFKLHPSVAADYVRKMSEIPPDVDAIIQQHHELPDGKGFPRGITASHISPLSSVFIISHDIAHQIFFPTSPAGFDLEVYLAEAQDRYQHSTFKKVLVAAKKLEMAE